MMPQRARTMDEALFSRSSPRLCIAFRTIHTPGATLAFSANAATADVAHSALKTAHTARPMESLEDEGRKEKKPSPKSTNVRPSAFGLPP
jgi:hypothetical protein